MRGSHDTTFQIYTATCCTVPGREAKAQAVFPSQEPPPSMHFTNRPQTSNMLKNSRVPLRNKPIWSNA